ncbi:MAG: hypothetical protein MUD11_13135 [Rhodobacteraceae bacterium]|nr:hypothetical protein [Paracoccaceae bacterium]
MAQKKLFSRGPFLMGLTMVIFGILAFAAIGLVPPGQSAETMARIGETVGMFGGAMIGVGLVCMLIGFLRYKRQS